MLDELSWCKVVGVDLGCVKADGYVTGVSAVERELGGLVQAYELPQMQLDYNWCGDFI